MPRFTSNEVTGLIVLRSGSRWNEKKNQEYCKEIKQRRFFHRRFPFTEISIPS